MIGLILAAALTASPHSIDAAATLCGDRFGSAASRKVSSLRRPDPSVICFSGPIDETSGQRLSSVIRRAKGSTATYLILNSSGGDAEVGLKLGASIAERNITSVVDGVCASSCANYLFLGARRRAILKGSLLVFHGGFGPQALAQVRPTLEALKRQQPSIDVDAAAGVENRKIELGVADQSNFLEHVHVRPEVFSLFDDWEAGRIVPAGDCRSNPQAAGVVFSPPALASLGIKVADNRGVTTAGQLRTALHAMGHDGALCFWAEPIP